jgi:hypothetical protein
MTLPGLVIALVLGAMILRISRTMGRGSREGVTTSAGFDVLSELLNPADRHRLEEERREALRRDDAEDGAPPRSRVDLESGTAHLRLPRS